MPKRKRRSNPQKDDPHEQTTNPDLLDENVEVFFDTAAWHVKTTKAKRASDTFPTKAAAIQRAKEIAANKGSKVISYTKDGKKQQG